MIERKCGTCKYYEPAPIWRKGWCRHPLLYAPHQSHLVSEDDLDCDRGMGNYWEPADDLPRELDPAFALRAAPPLPDRGERPPYTQDTEGGMMDQQHTNPGTPPPEPDDEEYGEYGTLPPFRSRQAGSGHPFGMEQQYTYRAEERYWPDYLRIALPVLGVILMLALAWFWINSLLGGRADTAGTPTPLANSTVPALITGATATPAKATTPIPLTTPAPSRTAQATAAGTAAQGIQNGAKVVVANTGGSGVNLRAAPSTSGEVVKTLPEGTTLTVVGNSVNADGHVWWPVKTESGDSGYVVGDYLKPAS